MRLAFTAVRIASHIAYTLSLLTAESCKTSGRPGPTSSGHHDTVDSGDAHGSEGSHITMLSYQHLALPFEVAAIAMLRQTFDLKQKGGEKFLLGF